jgi:hypothetical protein
MMEFMDSAITWCGTLLIFLFVVGLVLLIVGFIVANAIGYVRVWVEEKRRK